MVLTLADDFAGTLSADTTTVTLISLDGDGGEETDDLERSMYITAVDDASTPKTISIKFPGAESGYYVLKVETEAEGMFDYSNLQVQTVGEVTGLSPSSGSASGGTLLTITGRHFSTDALDNPVTIGQNGPACIVESTSDTEIQCRIAETSQTVDGTDIVLVFLKLSEEAVGNCSGTDCLFTWLTPKHEVTGVEVTSNVAGDQIITITSDSANLFIDDTAEEVELWLDGVAQQTDSVNAGVAVFTVTDMLSTSTSDVKLLSGEGYSSTASVEAIGTITLAPKLMSVAPEVGSIGGSVITVTGSGFGTGTADLGLYDASTSTSICASTTVVSYGVFTCVTNTVEVSIGNTIQLEIGSDKYDCADLCTYEQASGTSPSISSASLDTGTGTMTIVGANYPSDDDYDAVITYKGVSQSAVISTVDLITADWSDQGVPLSAVGVEPVLVFISATDPDGNQLTAANADGVTLANAPGAAVTAALDCSFAGGC
jgi:hypothetical protein